MRRLVRIVLVVVFMAPTTSLAQAVLTGHVSDIMGVPIDGALVEATSPVLIEQVRTTSTDKSGRYRIEALRPGIYAIQVSVAGYNKYRLDYLELFGSRTFVLNVGLTQGLAETFVIPWEAGVDVHSATRQIVIDDSVIRAIPNRRNYNSLLVVVPGVTTDRDDMVVDPLATTFPIHGGRPNEGRLLVDGMSAGSAVLGGQPAHYIADVGNSEEVVFTTSGRLGEAETGGPVMNIVPKEGGNTTRGSAFFSGNNQDMQGSNLTDELRSLGVTRGPVVTSAWDLDVALGGRIARDRVWYFVNGRRQSLTRTVPGLYYNLNAGNPASWLYSPDLRRPVFSDRTWENVGARVTLLATKKNRFSFFHDEQAICRSCSGATSIAGFPDPRVSPEAQGVDAYQPQRLTQLSWMSPATNRMLFEAGFARNEYEWGNGERDDNDRSLVRVTNLAANFSGTYRGQDWSQNRTAIETWHASLSHWVGAHSFKVGYEGLFAADDRTFHSNNQNVTYGFFGAETSRITMVISPFTTLARVAQTSAYAQDQWTLGRVTLQGALRYDRVRSWFPEQRIENFPERLTGPTQFLPSVLVLPETRGVDAYNDVTPRVGVAYDIFGDSKTAVKFSAGKYLEGAGTSGIYYDTNPATRVQRNVSRSWQDSNHDYIPNCDLARAEPNGECGFFETSILLGQMLPLSYDPDLLSGFHVRPSDWSIGASIEHQVLWGASVEVGYSRRSFAGFTVTDNIIQPPANFGSTVTAPTNPILPNGGGQRIGPLYSLLGFPPPQRVVTASRTYGNQYQYSDSFDVVFNGRSVFGVTMQGGSSTSRTVRDSCEIRVAVPESAPFDPYCHASTGALTQFRGLAAYTVPAIDVQIGAVYQNKPGPQISAIATLPFGPLSTTVNVLEPGTVYGRRIDQLDLRVAKGFKFGRMRSFIGVDVYNALNSSDALTYSSSYTSMVSAGRILVPTSIIQPRVLRFSADVSF